MGNNCGSLHGTNCLWFLWLGRLFVANRFRRNAAAFGGMGLVRSGTEPGRFGNSELLNAFNTRNNRVRNQKEKITAWLKGGIQGDLHHGIAHHDRTDVRGRYN